jgi:hypothetical protein
MELLNNLAEVGITTKILQYAILAGIVIFLIGMYWRFIVIGAGIIACLFIFLAPSQSATIAFVPNNTQAEVIDSADVVPPQFIEDCLRYTDGATKSSCEKSWKEQGNGKE